VRFNWRKTDAKKPAAARPAQSQAKAVERQTKHAHAEIHAYISIRDQLLTEAEEIPSNSTLHRATIANDVVEIFLKPAKRPYEAQYLPENEAAGERERCETVKNRIVELRKKIATAAGGTVQKSQSSSVFGVRAIGTSTA
jgi:hypothetical protein